MNELGLPQQPLDRAFRRRAEPAFADAMQALRDEADLALTSPLRPESRNGGYYHNYFCPDHAAELTFDERNSTRHICPVDDHLWSGHPFDDAWLWTANRRLAQRAYRLSLLWRIEGDAAHFDKAYEILTEYAAVYPDVHSGRDAPSVGKITYHAMDESVWAIPVTWACHWIWPDLDDATRDCLRTRLLEPAAAHIDSQRVPRIHNYENWLNAALATLGTALGNDVLVESVLDATYGVTDQLARGVLDDGHWYEGASSYHYFTLGAVLAFAQAREGLPGDPRQDPRVRQMFEAPLRIAYPDDYVPAINDCWYHSRVTEEVGHGIPSGPAFYEVATGWYGSEEFEAVLTRAYQLAPRTTIEALLYGADLFPQASSSPTVEANEAASGFAVLRPELPIGSAGELLLKYGHHGGGHGHSDKLAVSIFGGGERWGADLGTPGYGIPMNESWYRHTLSHSTVILEGEAQPPATGEMRRFRPVRANPFGIIDAQVVWEQGPYAAAYARRIILARDGYFLVLTRVEVPVVRHAHVAFHHAGLIVDWPVSGVSTANLPENEAYAHLSDVLAWPLDESVAVKLDVPVQGKAEASLVVSTAAIQGASLISARSPGNPASDLRSTVLVNVKADAFWTATAFVYGDDTDVVWQSGSRVDGPDGVLVRTGAREEQWGFMSDSNAEFTYPVLDG